MYRKQYGLQQRLIQKLFEEHTGIVKLQSAHNGLEAKIHYIKVLHFSSIV